MPHVAARALFNMLMTHVHVTSTRAQGLERSQAYQQRGLYEAQNGYVFCMLLGQVAVTCSFQA